MAHILEGKVVRLWFTESYTLPFNFAQVLEVKDGLIRFKPISHSTHFLEPDFVEDIQFHWFHLDKIHSFHELKSGTDILGPNAAIIYTVP